MRTSRPASCGRATASRRTAQVCDGVLRCSLDNSRGARVTETPPARRLLDGLQGPAEHGHGRRGRRRRRAARALLLARRLVRGTGAHRADARVTYWKGRVVVWEHVWRLETGRCASIAAAARSGGVESRARGSATRRANRTSPVPPAVLRRRGVARVVRYAMDVSNRAAGQGAGPDGVQAARQLRCANARARRE